MSRCVVSASIGLSRWTAARSFATAAHVRVPLAYEHHLPPKDGRRSTDQPIIFMHGLFGSKKNNRTVSKVLARNLKRHVYTVDLRNHGDSPHNARHDYLAMADDVAGFIEQHKLKDSTLIGHSMGAKTAMTLALSKPDMVNNLVAVDMAPVDAALSGFGKYIQAMRKIEEAGVTRQAEADAILQETEPDLAIRQFLLGNLYQPKGSETKKFRVPVSIIAKELDKMGDFPFKNPDEVRFVKPALFIRGTRSRYVPDESIPVIGRFFPLFRLVDIESGHWVTAEKPHEFIEAVTEFLEAKD